MDHQNLTFLRFPSPLQAFVNQLVRVSISLDLLQAEPQIAVIPLQALSLNDQRLYGTPLALQWAAAKGQTAAELSRQIVQAFASTRFDVCTDDSGWIYITLSDATISTWLDQLTLDPPQRLPYPGVRQQTTPVQSINAAHLGANIPSELLFPVQYAHARCCSLLRMADRDRRIQLTDPEPEFSPPLWRMIAPSSIPWLTPTGQLRLQHPQEKLLINQLLNFFASFNAGYHRYAYLASNLENLAQLTPIAYPPRPQILKRQLLTWSDCFEKFYRSCRIWGDIQQPDQLLAEARLGLLVATQAVLHFYLSVLLEVVAPLEL